MLVTLFSSFVEFVLDEVPSFIVLSSLAYMEPIRIRKTKEKSKYKGKNKIKIKCKRKNKVKASIQAAIRLGCLLTSAKFYVFSRT